MSAKILGMADKSNAGLTRTLISVLKSLMTDGSLALGSRLPPERQLAEQFGVHRSSLRQALKALETMGVLTQRVGDGTYVTSDAASILSAPIEFMIIVDGISFTELMEARLIVEPELAARAAERATSNDLTDLRAALDAMKAGRHDRIVRAQHDLTFHEAIARASANRVCQRMFSAIHKATIKSILLATSVDNNYKETIRFHEAIYKAIWRRESEEARRQMTNHLLSAKGLISSVNEGRPRNELRHPLAEGVSKIAPLK
jgi:GntR family transcriptional regulator, transcriptional repressor for pyruvate dehydrogenase complex